ncbi:hypothetical protein QJS10_CPB11g00644 [Acorus calamus]|uniref:Senescence regulator n=1 Tax=Acorus calamus TaxID=4465 RepID=A0AAV9DWF5_ACOCL|nr:hypothetical protein QJS10_CPB11g00644 [Acorus calamus]
MGEETPPPPIPSVARRNGSSSAVRFLGLLKQPDPAHHNSPPFEFDESDLIWSPSPSPPSPPSASLHLGTSLSSSPDRRRRRHFFPEDLSGLSVALASDDAPSPRVSHRRKDPSASAAVAARAVPPPRAAVSESAPVNVPAWPKGRFHVEAEVEAEMGLGEEEEEEEILPPHEIVARSQLTTFSVFEGVGRTLKGRDLHRVRNAVFQKTGFLD